MSSARDLDVKSRPDQTTDPLGCAMRVERGGYSHNLQRHFVSRIYYKTFVCQGVLDLAEKTAQPFFKSKQLAVFGLIALTSNSDVRLCFPPRSATHGEIIS